MGEPPHSLPADLEGPEVIEEAVTRVREAHLLVLKGLHYHAVQIADREKIDAGKLQKIDAEIEHWQSLLLADIIALYRNMKPRERNVEAKRYSR